MTAIKVIVAAKGIDFFCFLFGGGGGVNLIPKLETVPWILSCKRVNSPFKHQADQEKETESVSEWERDRERLNTNSPEKNVTLDLQAFFFLQNPDQTETPRSEALLYTLAS